MRKRLQRTILAACLMAAAGCTSLQNCNTNGFRLGPNHGRPCANTSSGWIDQNDAASSVQQEQETTTECPSPQKLNMSIEAKVLSKLLKILYHYYIAN